MSRLALVAKDLAAAALLAQLDGGLDRSVRGTGTAYADVMQFHDCGITFVRSGGCKSRARRVVGRQRKGRIGGLERERVEGEGGFEVWLNVVTLRHRN
jgi:hypothetical protein